MEENIYCTECEFLAWENRPIYSTKDGELYQSVLIVKYECSKHNKHIMNFYSNIYLPCSECKGKDFKFYTKGLKRLKPNF